MADCNARFPYIEQSGIEQLKCNSKNKNTTESTNFWVKVFAVWAQERGFSQRLESYEVNELDATLQQFYAEVRTKDGHDYEPDSLRVMIAALDRHLKEHGYCSSIIRDREFAATKQVLEGKAKQLRREGKGKSKNKARALS